MRADTEQNGDHPGDPTTRWDGYSNYKSVSHRVGKSIDAAIDAYAQVNSAHQERARLKSSVAADARARILSAALRLVPELENDREVVDEYDEILTRWKDGENGKEGFIDRLDEVQLQSECPGWLRQFVLDIRTAGWELGYLQAGRASKQHDDPVQEDVEAMF